MAKYIKNASKGVISLGSKNFIPGGDPTEVTAAEVAHPTIAAFIKAGKLEVVEVEAIKETTPDDDGGKEAAASKK